MANITLEDLKKIRDEKSKEIARRDTDKEIIVTVGMGTCGISAGAKKTLEALIDELDSKNIDSVIVKQTGCMGMCAVEPTITVEMPSMKTVTYKNVDEATAKLIVDEHIIGKKLVDTNIAETEEK